MTAAEPLMRGTFTFLFSDIEGSTATEARIGRERYAELRERHRALLRDVWEANDGQEEGTEGDSFFVAFREAPMAIAAAVAGQRALAAEPWPDDAPIRVRMGINSGGAERIVEADGTGGNLVGVAINRAARLAAVAHGGQILATGQTQALLIDDAAGRRRAARHRGASAPGPGFAGPDLPGRRRRSAGRVPADPDDRRAAEQPADPAHDVHRSRRGAGRGGRPAGIDPAADPDRAGRDRQDTALAPARGPGGRGLPGRRLLRRARAGPRARCSWRRGSPPRSASWKARSARSPSSSPTGCATSGCCSSSTTSSRSSPPPRSSRTCSAPRRTSRSSSRAGRVLHISGEQEYPVPGLPTPPDPSQLSSLDRMSLRRRGARRRSRGARPVRRGPPVHRAGRRRQARVRRDQRERAGRRGASAPVSTGCRWPSSSPRPGSRSSRRRRSSSASTSSSTSSRRGRATCPPGSRRCAARSPGATTCSTRGRAACSTGCRSSRAAATSTSAEAICGPAEEVGGDVLDGLMALADQSLIKVEETADGEPRFRLLDTIRAYAAERLEARRRGRS